MSRNRQLVRVLSLWKRLKDAPDCPRIDDLAEAYGVHRRTILRDLEALRAAGERVPESWWKAWS